MSASFWWSKIVGKFLGFARLMRQFSLPLLSRSLPPFSFRPFSRFAYLLSTSSRFIQCGCLLYFESPWICVKNLNESIGRTCLHFTPFLNFIFFIKILFLFEIPCGKKKKKKYTFFSSFWAKRFARVIIILFFTISRIASFHLSHGYFIRTHHPRLTRMVTARFRPDTIYLKKKKKFISL